MNDCINRPDRRLHLTQSSKTSNHPLHRGSHPQKTFLDYLSAEAEFGAMLKLQPGPKWLYHPIQITTPAKHFD
jgi:hypothetical protein